MDPREQGRRAGDSQLSPLAQLEGLLLSAPFSSAVAAYNDEGTGTNGWPQVSSHPSVSSGTLSIHTHGQQASAGWTRLVRLNQLVTHDGADIPRISSMQKKRKTAFLNALECEESLTPQGSMEGNRGAEGPVSGGQEASSLPLAVLRPPQLFRRAGRARLPTPALDKIRNPDLRKAEARKLRNRQTAAKSRERRRQYLEGLESRVADLEEENAQLKLALRCRHRTSAAGAGAVAGSAGSWHGSSPDAFDSLGSGQLLSGTDGLQAFDPDGMGSSGSLPTRPGPHHHHVAVPWPAEGDFGWGGAQVGSPMSPRFTPTLLPGSSPPLLAPPRNNSGQTRLTVAGPAVVTGVGMAPGALRRPTVSPHPTTPAQPLPQLFSYVVTTGVV